MLSGNHVLLVTPFARDLDVDETSLRRLIDHTIAGGVHGVIPLGTTGEFFTLSDAEKRRVIDVTIDHVGGRVPVTVGVGHSGTQLAADLARYAEERGASAILLPPPYYYNTGPAGMRLHFDGVARAVGIDVMLYDGGGGIEIPLDVIADVRASHSHVNHVKLSVLSSAKVTAIRRAFDDRVAVLCGDEVMLMPELRQGARGMATAAGNVLPRVATAICDLAARGQDAAAHDLYLRQLAPWVASTGIAKGEFIRCFKEALAHLGVIVCPATRPPVPALSDVRLRDVFAAVDLLCADQVIDA
jgi:4-hydroxy-tetrahydrodipicolinate synthase